MNKKHRSARYTIWFLFALAVGLSPGVGCGSGGDRPDKAGSSQSLMPVSSVGNSKGPSTQIYRHALYVGTGSEDDHTKGKDEVRLLESSPNLDQIVGGWGGSVINATLPAYTPTDPIPGLSAFGQIIAKDPTFLVPPQDPHRAQRESFTWTVPDSGPKLVNLFGGPGLLVSGREIKVEYTSSGAFEQDPWPQIGGLNVIVNGQEVQHLEYQHTNPTEGLQGRAELFSPVSGPYQVAVERNGELVSHRLATFSATSRSCLPFPL